LGFEAAAGATQRVSPTWRRRIIMLLDLAMTMAALPAALAFTKSDFLNNSFAAAHLAIWMGACLLAHFLFRANGLYDTLWRFASTQDFFNIIRSCALLTASLYLIATVQRYLNPFIGLNEREFLIFFLLEFALISGPRLIYRYLRDGERWRRMSGFESSSKARRALFVGSAEDADLTARYVRARRAKDLEIVGILKPVGEAESGAMVQGIPVLGTTQGLLTILEEFTEADMGVQALIIGPHTEPVHDGLVDLIRLARKRGVEVLQFSGFSPMSPASSLTLSKVDMETLLRRPAISLDQEALLSICRGRRILVTGGAGSIGSQIVLRALELGAARVLVFDRSEPSIFALLRRIPAIDRDRVEARVVDICRPELFRPLMRDFRPDVIFHAAALKHVPFLELDWASAIDVNVFGTLHCAEAALDYGVGQFILISSDKAAEPESVLGLTKRMAEQIVNAYHAGEPSRRRSTRFHAVRFGNVFASNGSAAIVFKEQIENGGPVTVTHPEMTRYFMVLQEAVDLVLLAAASAQKNEMRESGIFMLDMGEPVRILEIAENMIRLAGKKPYEEIDIVFTGVRPGEKMHEALVSDGEQVLDIGVSGVYALGSKVMNADQLQASLRTLKHSLDKEDRDLAIGTMRRSWKQSNFPDNVIDLYSTAD
jgi:O-antigen biosynthesis protein WbqV